MAGGILQALVAEPFQTPRRWPRPTGAEVRKAARVRAEAAVALAAAQLSLDLDLDLPVQAEVGASPPDTAARAAALFAWAKRAGSLGYPFMEAFERLQEEGHEVAHVAVAKRNGWLAVIRACSTPAGWSSGFHYDSPTGGSTEGGGLDPLWDDEGAFYWRTREAAIHDGGRRLIEECRVHGNARYETRTRAFLVQRGLDPDTAPDASLQRRFVSRAEIAVAVEPTLDPADTEPSDARRAYETAEGLTDVDLPPPGPPPARVRRPRTQPPSERLTAVLVAAGLARKPSPSDVDYVEAAIAAILPPGVPSYAQEIVYVRRTPGMAVARIRLWDGEVGTLLITGQPGGHGYRWEETGREDRRPFHWDVDEGGWIRIEEEAPTP